MVIALFLSIAITIIGIVLLKNNKIDTKYKFFILMGTGLLCLGILVFPLLDYSDTAIKITNAFYYALKSIPLNEDIDVLSKINIYSAFGFIYFVWINLFLIALPFFTVSTLIAILSDLLKGIKFRNFKNKSLYFFSEMNEKSLMIAKYYVNNNSAVIFTNVENKKDNKTDTFKAIRISEKITEINLNNYDNNIAIYMISENEERNLNDALEIMNKYKNKKIKIYVINNTEEAPTILDSANREIINKIKLTERKKILTKLGISDKVAVDAEVEKKIEEELMKVNLSDKEFLNVEIVNETERAIFNLLDKKPIYEGAINNVISLLIVGCGQVGKEFLKDALWCGMMVDYRFKALVVDIKADEIKKNIEAETPELLNNYDITFVNADIKSPNAIKAIEQVNDINYILVSMESDNKNLNTAIDLRRLFIRYFERKPIINIWIENEYKKEQVNKLINERETAYDINAFGSIKDMYFDNKIVDSEIEKIGEKIHKAYRGNPVDYYLNEYNKRSSRASGLHVKYKLYSILKENYSNDLHRNLKMFEKIHTDELEEILAKNEHDRWNAYMRTIGYTKATINEVRKYYPALNDHRDYLGRRHPALVPYEELDSVSYQLQNIGINKDLKSSDHDIVKMMLKDFIE